MSDSNSRFNKLNTNLANYYDINNNTIKYNPHTTKPMYSDTLDSFENLPVNNNKLKYTTKYPVYQHICSNDRDRIAYPDTNNFKITFQNRIKNVVEIELITAIIPNTATILNEPHLVISIDELKSNINFNSTNIQDCFAILPLKKPNKDTDGFIIPELGQNNKLSMKFKTPLASLDQMTIGIKDMYGALYSFGSDPGPYVNLANSKKVQVTFVFKITVVEPEINSTIPTQYIN